MILDYELTACVNAYACSELLRAVTGLLTRLLMDGSRDRASVFYCGVVDRAIHVVRSSNDELGERDHVGRVPDRLERVARVADRAVYQIGRTSGHLEVVTLLGLVCFLRDLEVDDVAASSPGYVYEVRGRSALARTFCYVLGVLFFDRFLGYLGVRP